MNDRGFLWSLSCIQFDLSSTKGGLDENEE